MHPPFPFSAIVGQESLKRALILCVIQPSVGGVLVRGAKGVAKSTAVRGLTGLLPPIETISGCPFNRLPDQEIPGSPMPAAKKIIRKQVPLVELPLGATEDRVLGSIHLERAIQSGRREFEPGLLAAANRGILYVDEVNLLPDHLVDVLLDAAATGVHRLEREGISLEHPAGFVLVGTMNPEEGHLRPQLLDRFGLVVDVHDLENAADRAEAVRRRLEYERHPAQFAARWRAIDDADGRRILEAQRTLPLVSMPAGLLEEISRRCRAAGTEGLRADLTIARAGSAWAAYHGRKTVTLEDVAAVEEMAMAHRRTKPPEPPGAGPGKDGDKERSTSADGQAGGPRREAPAASVPLSGSREQVFEIAPVVRPYVLPNSPEPKDSRTQGRQRGTSRVAAPLGGGMLRRQRSESSTSIAISATLRAAAPHQSERRNGHAEMIIVRTEDLRWNDSRRHSPQLLLFVVDASGSMASRRRMRQTKAAIVAVLMDLHRRGDRAALLAFSEQKCELIQPPTRSLFEATKSLERLPVGGRTPLALGLHAAADLAGLFGRRQKERSVRIVLLTDGRANQSRAHGNPLSEALAAARQLTQLKLPVLVVDTEAGPHRQHWAGLLARELGAQRMTLEEVLQPLGAAS